MFIMKMPWKYLDEEESRRISMRFWWVMQRKLRSRLECKRWITSRFFIFSNLWDNLLKGVVSLTFPVLALRSILLQSVPRIYANSTPNTRTGVEYLWHKEIQDVPMKSGSAWSRNAVPAVSLTNVGVRNIIFIQATFTTRYEGSESLYDPGTYSFYIFRKAGSCPAGFRGSGSLSIRQPGCSRDLFWCCCKNSIPWHSDRDHKRSTPWDHIQDPVRAAVPLLGDLLIYT